MLDSVIDAALARAVAAAEAFRGATSPNPPVGCVLLDAHGKELAVAAHQKAGKPHAEALAIAACRLANVAQRIHTAVVTLEPCNHTGRTPPCTAALLGTPVKRVVIGCRDPNPRVAGGGAQRLSDAGIEVLFASHAGCRDLLAPFRKHVLTGLPWVTVKQALNTDGNMVPPPGQKTFTSESSLTLAHELRKRADAILTGSGTILADNPMFTVRRVEDFQHKRRALVIMDRRRRLSENYIAEAEARGFDVVVATDVDAILRLLGERGCLEVLIEAGPAITQSILEHGQWDEHIVIQQKTGGYDVITRRLRIQHDDD
jgi:diaminohydroxyphosphoribosylaminopyrimidine deaminase / 5-amino-6-(5-phosphoribosylamino)uracil reductase